MSDTSNSQGYFGWEGLTDAGGEYNRHAFAIRQENGRVRTSIPVKVVAVHPDKNDPISNAPTIDVQPLINQIDGQGNPTPHVTVYGIPTTRVQGGDSVVINDPVVGDFGTMAIHDRDISTLKSSGNQSNPGSFRRFDMADGVYHGPMLNKTKVKQYIQFMRNSDGSGNGVKIVDNVGNTIVSTSSGVNINGLIIDKNGNLTTPGSIQAGTGGSDSVTLQNHQHAGGPKPDPGT
jgi:hypothetical protein